MESFTLDREVEEPCVSTRVQVVFKFATTKTIVEDTRELLHMVVTHNAGFGVVKEPTPTMILFNEEKCKHHYGLKRATQQIEKLVGEEHTGEARCDADGLVKIWSPNESERPLKVVFAPALCDLEQKKPSNEFLALLNIVVQIRNRRRDVLFGGALVICGTSFDEGEHGAARAMMNVAIEKLTPSIYTVSRQRRARDGSNVDLQIASACRCVTAQTAALEAQQHQQVSKYDPHDITSDDERQEARLKKQRKLEKEYYEQEYYDAIQRDEIENPNNDGYFEPTYYTEMLENDKDPKHH